jgi:uncharacterized membrane protein
LLSKGAYAKSSIAALASSGNGSGLTDGFRPQVVNLEIVDSSEYGIVIQAEVNFTNPTNYSATIPFSDISIEKNGTAIGHARVENATIVAGKNHNIMARAVWEPKIAGGKDGMKVGRELLSQYISGT